MYKKNRVAALIAAGGSGTRLGGDIPKQYLNIEGVPMIVKSVGAFEENETVDVIVIVASADYVDTCHKLFEGCEKVKAIVCGGKQRQDSVAQGLRKLAEIGYDLVLIHDAARPYVSQKIVADNIEMAERIGACITAVPVKDTIRHKSITLNRDELYSVQTPQSFKKTIIEEAYQKAFADGFYGTDDGGLVERIGKQVAIVPGDYTNIKITTAEDMPRKSEDLRIGTGFDVHKLVEGRKCILGGVEIPFEKGLLGHSDADVLTHAIMDAILGAAAMGDIGKLFPDDDPKYEGISSMLLLKQVGDILTDFDISNIDATLICQAPKIAAYTEEMKTNIAEALGISTTQINVKGTTTEKLGFTGRGEGIACEAVCILKEK